MVKDVNGIMGLMLLTAAALGTATSVSADEIALTFAEQGFTLTGTLEGLTDVGYVITTENGEFTIPFNYVTCEGAACPVLPDPGPAES